MKRLGGEGRVLTGILKTKWIRCDTREVACPDSHGVSIHLLNFNDVWVSFLEGFEKNFESYGPERLDSVGEPYDFDSLMHYDNQAFSKNGQNTLESLADPTRSLGNMDDFSKIDIKQLLKSYPCKAGDKKPKDKKKERSPESKSVFFYAVRQDLTTLHELTLLSFSYPTHRCRKKKYIYIMYQNLVCILFANLYNKQS